MSAQREIMIQAARKAASYFAGAVERLARPVELDSMGSFTKLITPHSMTSVPPPAQTRNLLLLYRNSPWVRMMVGKVARSCAEAEFVMEDSRKQTVEQHPVLDFLRSGSEFLTAEQSLTVHYAYMDLVGESFWLVGRDNKGLPASYMPVPPNWVLDVAVGPKKFYTLSPANGTPVQIPAADMIWFKDVDPVNPIERGTSIIRAMHTEIEVDRAISDYVYHFLRNRARPDIVVSGTTAAPLSDADIDRLEQVWLPKFGGSRNAGRPFFASNEMKVTPLQANMREHQMTEMRTHQAQVLSELMAIPPEIFGRLENSNRATVEGADYLYSKHVVSPRVRLTTGILDARLFYEFKNAPGMRLRHQSLVEENVEFQLKAVVAAPSAFRKNDIRRMANLPPLEGEVGDEFLKDAQAVTGNNRLEKPDVPGGTGVAKKPVGQGKKKGAPEWWVERSIDRGDVLALVGDIDITAIDSDLDGMVQLALETAYQTIGNEIAGAERATFRLEPDAALYISNRVDRSLAIADKTTDEAITAALSELPGRDDVSLGEVIALVRGVFATARSQRARMIATTEAGAMGGYASLSMLRQMGETSKTWQTMADDAVRPEHEGLHLQERQVDEMFRANNGATGMAPGELSDPRSNIGCRCIVTRQGSRYTTEMHAAVIAKVLDVILPELRARFDAQQKVVERAVKALFAGDAE